jgi:hypothetical protein
MGASRCFWNSETPPAIKCIFNDRCFSLVVRSLSRSPKYHFACASQLKTALSPSTMELWPGSNAKGPYTLGSQTLLDRATLWLQ